MKGMTDPFVERRGTRMIFQEVLHRKRGALKEKKGFGMTRKGKKGKGM